MRAHCHSPPSAGEVPVSTSPSSRLTASGLLFSSFISICSVQKLSEFFSSDEIGEEQEPRALLSSSSSNHNQNRYQAVVGTSPHTRSCCVYMLSTWVRWRHLSPCCIQAVSRCSACCFPFFTSSHSSCRGCSLFFFVDLHRLVIAVFCPFCPLSPVC